MHSQLRHDMQSPVREWYKLERKRPIPMRSLRRRVHLHAGRARGVRHQSRHALQVQLRRRRFVWYGGGRCVPVSGLFHGILVHPWCCDTMLAYE